MKRVSIRDVARQAGVSITTVSKALNNYPDVNEQTRKRIQDIVQKMGYVPDMMGRSMGGISDPVIGLLINDLAQEDYSGSVYGYLSGVHRACRGSNIGFVLAITDWEAQLQTSLQQLCLSKGLSGLVCTGFRASDPYVKQIAVLDIPCVCMDFKADGPMAMEVTIDNVQAANDAVTFLIQSGRKNIAMLSAQQEIDVANRRSQGYWNALSRAGYPYLPQRMIDADFDQEIAYQKAKELLRSDAEVDAFFCASDLMALGACQAVTEIGWTVGKDISIVGFDDIPVARYLYGGLTTIRQDFYNMGFAAGQMLRRRLLDEDSRPPEVSKQMLYELVVRGSAPAHIGSVL